ncbi:Uncharacterised protein [Enterobacter cloacae]|nr:Uncharacterised protein [Enterobacter cloacae]
MPEAADGDQHDGDIRVAGHGYDGQRNHQKRAGDGAGYHRVDAGAAKPAGVEPGQVAARHAAEVGGQERQPGEHRDLFQIHTMLFGEVQRHPEAQHGPGRFRHKGRDGDTVEPFVLRDGFQRGQEGQFDRRRFVILLDKRQLIAAQVWVLFRVVIKRPPQDHPQQRQHAGKHKRTLPAERRVSKVDDRRGQHGPNGEAYPRPACGNRAL